MTSEFYDPDCIFCKIVSGEVTAKKVYEDSNYFAFLDIEPKTKGDTLLVPKDHYRWTYEVPNMGEYWETCKMLTQKLMNALGADWTNFFTYGHIAHAHIHIMPRYGDIFDEENVEIIPQKISLTEEEMEAIAEKIRKAS